MQLLDFFLFKRWLAGGQLIGLDPAWLDDCVEKDGGLRALEGLKALCAFEMPLGLMVRETHAVVAELAWNFQTIRDVEFLHWVLLGNPPYISFHLVPRSSEAPRETILLAQLERNEVFSYHPMGDNGRACFEETLAARIREQVAQGRESGKEQLGAVLAEATAIRRRLYRLQDAFPREMLNGSY